MADNVPEKLKAAQIAPFLQRAQQLEPYKPLISYWRKSIAANHEHMLTMCSAILCHPEDNRSRPPRGRCRMHRLYDEPDGEA